MKIFGYLTVYFKVTLSNGEILYNSAHMDFSNEINQEVFDVFEHSIRKYYRERFSLDVQEIESVTEEEFNAHNGEHPHGVAYSFSENDSEIHEF